MTDTVQPAQLPSGHREDGGLHHSPRRNRVGPEWDTLLVLIREERRCYNHLLPLLRAQAVFQARLLEFWPALV